MKFPLSVPLGIAHLLYEDVIEGLDVVLGQFDDSAQVLLVVLEQRLVNADEDLASSAPAVPR